MDHYDYDVLIGATLPVGQAQPEPALHAAVAPIGDCGSRVDPDGTREGHHDAR
ncbi:MULTISPECIES: hypothetical protein [Burkholderia]|uniref:hypothetical protein n=1 Tax=Burkholderia TaxID=32008 RepID=UPI000531F2B8|nr:MULTISPECIES: hypothetical protein [Burkholderia]KGS00704.1 hypothetical protein X946_3785 [Burkholderia sp. ABCPW 111]